MDEELNENQVKFSLTYCLDKDKYFRRMCPSCGREFKTEINEADIAALLQPTFKRIETEIGQELSLQGQEPLGDYLYCPYCEHCDLASEMLTSEFSRYLRRLVMREYVLPMINNTFSDIANSFSGRRSRSSGGMFSIDMTFEHSRSILPPRPIHGPEPPDMIIIEMLCCHKKIKISEKWHHLKRCPYCGVAIILQL